MMISIREEITIIISFRMYTKSLYSHLTSRMSSHKTSFAFDVDLTEKSCIYQTRGDLGIVFRINGVQIVEVVTKKVSLFGSLY